MNRHTTSIFFIVFFCLLGQCLTARTPEAVDLGLSVKWAGCNLGADYSGQEGEPFALGELTTKNRTLFTQDYYKVKGDWKSLYEFDEDAGKYILKSEYDMCRNAYGNNWRLPTEKEWMELANKCRLEWVKGKGLNYIKATGPNGNSILLPIPGNYDWDRKSSALNKKSKCHDRNKTTFYWTSTLGPESSFTSPISIFSYKGDKKTGRFSSWKYASPYRGHYVRAVYDPSLDDGDDLNNDDHRVDPNPEPGPTPVDNRQKPQLTVIGWAESTHSPKVTLQVGVKSASSLTATAVYVNGQQMRGIKAVGNDGYDLVIRQEISLRSGSNTVRVDVTNRAGTASVSREVFYMPVQEDDRDRQREELRKVAFVIGNSAYPGNKLRNPKNDAADISVKLRDLGFDVTTLIDGSHHQIDEAFRSFVRKAKDADVAMVFYAGHGIQYRGANYLIPVDAQLTTAKDIEYECTNVNRLLANLEESGCKMVILALDACRNNPLERAWYNGSTSRGLSVINAPIGTFISYSTSPGNVAADGKDRNSPYTAALLKTLDRPGLTIESVFKNVGAEVVKATERQQTPWYSSSIYEGEFIFNPAH